MNKEKNPFDIFMVDPIRVLYTILRHLFDLIVELEKLPLSRHVEQVELGYKIRGVIETITLIRERHCALDDPALFGVDEKIRKYSEKVNQYFEKVLQRI